MGFIGGEIVLPSFLSYFHLSHLSSQELASARSLAVTAWIVGALMGVIAGKHVCSQYGRRRGLQFAAGLYITGALAQTLNFQTLSIFDTGRLVNGAGVGVGSLISPMYIAEISPAADRSMLTSGFQVLVQLGALAGFWTVYISQATLPDISPLQYLLPISLQLLGGFLLLAGCLFIPDSPRYHAERGQHTLLQDSLSWLRRQDVTHPDIQDECSEIEITACSSEKALNFWHEICKPHLRRRLAVGIGLMIAQNMSGMNAINYYAPVIFFSAGFNSVSASLLLGGIFSIIKLMASILYMLKLVNVRGNRFWLLFGCSTCGTTMVILACCVRATSLSESSSVSVIGVLSLLMVYAFTCFFTVSLGK
jgi:MFS family permease